MALDENEAGDRKFLLPKENNPAICHREISNFFNLDSMSKCWEVMDLKNFEV